MEDSNRIRANTRQSWVESWSSDPRPSESRTIKLTIWLSSVCALSGRPHIQMPLVHALTVEPIVKPFSWFRMIRFSR